jgi:hypothetical protein
MSNERMGVEGRPGVGGYGQSIMDREDFRTRWTKQTIERLEERRRRDGEEYIKVAVDTYITLLMENLSLQQSQQAMMKQYGETMALYTGVPKIYRDQQEHKAAIDPLDQVKIVDPGQDPMVNCDHCKGRHLASMECPFDPATEVNQMKWTQR